MSEIFDFGFTSVTLDELEDYQEAKAVAEGSSAEVHELQARLDKLYSSFLPLLNNLKKDTHKDYILWPNRLDKIEEFESVLHKIYTGK